MIVRCNNCESAFSVDDDKVANKIFAFTCPKCSNENIVNNKIKEKDNIKADLNETKLSGGANRKLNLEIEESENIHDIESDDSIFEEPVNNKPASKKEDESIFEEASAFELEETDTLPADEFDIELEKDTDIVKDDGDAVIDDFGDIDLISEGDDHLINDDIINSSYDDSANKKSKDKTKTISDDDLIISLDDMDMTSDDDITSDNESDKTFEPSVESNKAETGSDDLTIDIDSLDIDLDETLTDQAINDKKDNKSELAKDEFDDEDIKLNLDELDIDIDEIENKEPISKDDSVTKTDTPLEKQIDSDDLTIDIDSLDIDLDETLTDQAINDKKDNKSELAKDEFDDEDLKLNLDELDIDIDEIESTELIPKDDPATKMDEPIEKQTDSDDLIIDIDNLDIDLDETLTDQAINDKKNNKNELAKDEFDDEDIKLNLDELDIDIDEIDNNEPVIDEDNERLSLDDAGLTFDELAPEAESDGINELSDDEIHLTLEDIDPDLTLEEIMEVAETDGELALNSLEEFPEVYANEHDATIQTKNRKKSPANLYMDELITDNSDYDIDDYDESEQYNKRSTSFSIDFSLKYSRIQACLRLLFLYFISMIPHFIVLIIYSALSIILGFINQLVVLSTGRCVGDFALIIENTMRYILYIKTNLIGIVEDRPIYAGRKYIDHPLQFDVVFPSRYSKKMAILRLSIVGIVLISLPHIILLTILSLTMPICYLIGILSVIITSQLPNILFKYLTRYFRYIAHVGSFMSGLTDDYPSFRL